MPMTVKCCILIVLVAHLILVSPAENVRRKRSLRWVTKESALSYLTKEMSYMKEFKDKVLLPLMKERVSGTPENKAVQNHIKEFLTKLGWTVEEDRFLDETPYKQKEFTNIIATYNPSKPNRVVIACHFDSKYFPEGGFVGATDSAVPCAIMLETAFQLQCLLAKGSKEKSSAKDLTLQMIFFDGEEAFKEWTDTDSIYGARHLAKKWDLQMDENGQTELHKIRELILLDLIGTSDTKFSQHFPQTAELYASLVKTETLLRNKGFLTGNHPGPIFTTDKGWAGIEDDHIPFLRKGVPILHLISTPFPKVWHKMSDNWKNLDFDLIDDFSRIFRLFVSNLLHLEPEYRGCRKK